MALNPPLVDGAMPVLLEREVVVLSRPGIVCEVKVANMDTLKEEGKVFLSSQRLVFVCNKPKSIPGGHFISFEFPLITMTEEKFNQPVFGCNNLAGKVEPLEGSGIDAQINFKLYYKEI